jgi:hypothetical protein
MSHVNVDRVALLSLYYQVDVLAGAGALKGEIYDRPSGFGEGRNPTAGAVTA